ncbi:MAG TPA: superoxide dismutase [Salinivirgaceae bacterium]|nr:superoxide dismutase [Salinivirgaceae bacterium]
MNRLRKNIIIAGYSFILMAVATGFAFGQHKLPELPYKYDALEPHIDSTTMRIHHTAHHQAYVNNLNKALEKHPQYQSWTLGDLLMKLNSLPEDIQTAVHNNGGGHYNHTFFWDILAPAGSSTISSALENAIVKYFGSVDKFKEDFEKAALGRFGSGWVWLLKKEDGTLYIESTPNQDNILMPYTKIEGKPILALDVWEHAYYLKYQSKRGGYVKAFWNVVNWSKVAELGGY